MLIHHISHTSCPDCNCDIIIKELKEKKHINGNWNEYRTFQCGKSFHFSPNFNKILNNDPCRGTPEYKAIIENRESVLNKVRNYIDKQKIDNSFKNRLKYALKYINTSSEIDINDLI